MQNAQLFGLILVSFGVGSLLCACMPASAIMILIGALTVIVGVVLLKRYCH